MGKIKLICDSMADLTKDQIEKYDIEVLPLTVILDDKEYKDGTEFILKLPNIKIEEKDLKINNDIDVDDKKIIEKINIEFSDIYELRN